MYQTTQTKPKKQKASITRGRARKDKGFQSPPEKGGSMVSQSLEKIQKVAKTNPVASLAAYDLGKGILGKITKTLGRAATVRGGRAIQVSAGK